MIAARLSWWLSVRTDPGEAWRWLAFAWTFFRRMVRPPDDLDGQPVPGCRSPLVVASAWLELTGCPQCALAVAAGHADVEGQEATVALLRDWAFVLATGGRNARNAHPKTLGWCRLRPPPAPEALPTPEDLDRVEAEEAEQELRREALSLPANIALRAPGDGQ